MITFAIVVVILLLLAAIGYFSGRWEDSAQAKEVNFYQGVEVDAKLLELDKRALDEAYHGHLVRLWNVWLGDGARSANQITTGLRISRDAYHQAAGQIAKREQELKK